MNENGIQNRIAIIGWRAKFTFKEVTENIQILRIFYYKQWNSWCDGLKIFSMCKNCQNNVRRGPIKVIPSKNRSSLRD